MNPIPRRARLSMLLRSFTVQGSWNYETLIGTGFAFTLLPALRHIHRGDPDALRASIERHAGLFNSHPYLIPVAAGAVARAEADGVSAPVIERFKGALRGSLGSMGDQLVWWAWRPMAAVLGVTMLLLGMAWWLVIVTFLAVYNILHVALRVWGIRTGTEQGMDVARALRGAGFHRVGRAATRAGLVLTGFATVLAFTALGGGMELNVVGVAAIAVGLALGLHARKVAWTALGTIWMLGMLFGTL